MNKSGVIDQERQILENIIKKQESVIAFQQEYIKNFTEIIEQSNKREDGLIILNEKLYAERLRLKQENAILANKCGILQKYGPL